MKKLNRLLYLSMILCIALVIYVVEAQIPVIFPGIKLGLANAVSLFVLISFGGKEAITIMVLRTFLGAVFGGNLFGFFFSLGGGLLSNLAMICLYKYFKDDISIPWLSMGGAIFHNIGQLLVAAIVIGDFKIYFYLPILMIAAIITGYFTGVVAENLNKRKVLKL
ncbi:Gx transporter family protein [Clostridium frigidicarnis]|uniref:Heptaprenyl diphosphate synthase n=1 Tax=Clostridium frigidicarnis TaxID=84698 RepID=A0A1I0YI97_9CLOT|nr:Gx transporter family protein [Clostridium frigidicarnis]SFB13165.1 heptaprenyl diphosphate synthase [Clostridium frigidicarnis]